MSVETKLYFKELIRPSIVDIILILEKEGCDRIRISPTKSKHFYSDHEDDYINYEYYNIKFVFDEKRFIITYSPYNKISGGKFDGWTNATISAYNYYGCWGDQGEADFYIKLFESIGSYFGGYLVEDDSVDEDDADYIRVIDKKVQTLDETNDSVFLNLVLKYTNNNFKISHMIVDFINKNEETVKKYLDERN